jgi:hypothetical protein
MALENFNVNLTNKIRLPDLDYINELAREKNFEFNGRFTSVPPIIEDLYFLYLKEREEEEEFEFKNHVFSKDTIKEQVLKRPLTESEEAYYNYSLKFLKDLNYRDCPGFSPMDKALNTIMYMNSLSKKNTDSNPTNNNSNQFQSLSPEALNSLIEEMSKGIEEPQLIEGKKKDGSETKKDVISCVRDYLYDLSPSIANIYGEDSIASVPINLKILKDIKTKAYLENSLGLETSLEKKLIENNNSKKKKIREMRSHGEVMKTSKTQMVLPAFDSKLAKKELTIKTKVKPETKKQMLTMLLDDSGSMNCIQKQSYVRAVLMNRLQSVIEGKAKLNFYLYETNRYGYKEVKDLKDAQELYKSISRKRPSGGGTHIGSVLQETINEIHDIPGYHDPEIIIVNDGDDYVNPSEIDLKGVRINVVMLGTTNANLKSIAEASGGFCVSEVMYARN